MPPRIAITNHKKKEHEMINWWVLRRDEHITSVFVNTDCDPLYGRGSWDIAWPWGFSTAEEAAVVTDILRDMYDRGYRDGRLATDNVRRQRVPKNQGA